jgi:hypothetical protein
MTGDETAEDLRVQWAMDADAIRYELRAAFPWVRHLPERAMEDFVSDVTARMHDAQVYAQTREAER